MMDISRKTKEYKISMFGLFRFSFMLDVSIAPPVEQDVQLSNSSLILCFRELESKLLSRVQQEGLW